MPLPTAELVLSNLPLALVCWTALSFSWGVYVLAAYNAMMRDADEHHGGRTLQDVYNSWFIKAGITLMLVALTFGPKFVQFSDSLVVVNIFFNAYLVSASITISHWWKLKNNP